jgi:hypothetical protein
MFRYILENKKPFYWFVFHILLGGLCIISPWFLVIWFYFVLISSVPSFIKGLDDRFFRFTGLIVYVVAFELLGRVSRASPFIPYEMGKYALLVFLSLGIILGYRRGIIGWLMLFLLIPGIFLDLSGKVGFKNVVANLFGPVSVALAVIYFKGQTLNEEGLKSLLRLIALPLVSVLSFVILKTPDFQNIEFELYANQETSGGWGSNQISTALGLGAFVFYIFWRNKYLLSGYRWIDFIFFILFTFRGLLTFSRGGMIGAFLAILIIFFYETIGHGISTVGKPFIRRLLKTLPVIIILLVIFGYADRIASGNLVLRYQGETPGTAAGYREKTLNTFTANRLNVFVDDLKLWKENPLLGVGTGASYYLRENTHRIAAHVELSRLLSEHGLFGLTYFFILCVLGYNVYRRASWTLSGPVLFAIFILALFTTFHSAMRTFVTPLLVGLSLIVVSNHEEVIE